MNVSLCLILSRTEKKNVLWTFLFWNPMRYKSVFEHG